METQRDIFNQKQCVDYLCNGEYVSLDYFFLILTDLLDCKSKLVPAEMSTD